jgi:hypothetical protein
VLEEWDQRGSDGGDLRRSDVHELYLAGGDYGEVRFLTSLDRIADEASIVIKRSIPLSDDELFFLLCGIVLESFLGEVHTAILHQTIRGSDEAKAIDLGIDTEGGDQTDVWSFWGLDRTETAIVGIVYVSHLEAGTLTG